MGKILPLVQGLRKDHPEQAKTRSETWTRTFLRSDPVFTGSKLALGGQKSGDEHYLGAEDSPQKH